MIEPYNIQEVNLNLILGNVMEDTFFFLPYWLQFGFLLV